LTATDHHPSNHKARMGNRPDIVLIVADDMGFSDLGCYGGEANTPCLDALGRRGTRFSQFYNSPRCSPSRASLLTGQYPHSVGVGILNFDDTPEGYPGNLSGSSVTIPEALSQSGYVTYMSGKWHIASDMYQPSSAWPTRRGFDHFFGTLDGAASYYRPHTLTRGEENSEAEAAQDADFYYTDAIAGNAVGFIEDHAANRADEPMFLYVPFTAPHWPLHAREEDIAKYRGRFGQGWDQLRQQRLQRLRREGLIDADAALSARDPQVPAWDEAEHKDWEVRRMEGYAAQIDRLDQGVQRIVDSMTQHRDFANTLFIFVSDNGGCAEEMPADAVEDFVTGFGLPLPETTKSGQPVVVGSRPDVMPGGEDTYQSYGRSWANLSNTPFREYKHWVHEGGISAPFIVHWPDGFHGGDICHDPSHLPDVLPTILDAAGATYPIRASNGEPAPALEGHSLVPMLRENDGGAWQDMERYLFWEHEGNAGVRRGRWKLVRKYGLDWELYDIDTDRAEACDRAAEHPELVREMAEQYHRWAERCGVVPREKVLALYAERGHALPEG